MYKIDRERKDTSELRYTVVQTLQELMDKDRNIIALDADLAGASGFNKFSESHSKQFINVGISEANMMGVAAGLSLRDKKPFVHTFAPFATRRALDQIFVSGAYAKTNINIYGSDPGFTAGANGGTHTTYEDIALLRSIPNITICDAADDVQMKWIIQEFAKMPGINYVRGNRKGVKPVYALDSTFEIGKANKLIDGRDILIISSGQLVSEALEAADHFNRQGVSVTVLDMFTIKPLDKEAIVKEMVGKSKVVTFENHSTRGGLGSAVAEVIAQTNESVNFKIIGVDERFGQVGTPEFLQKEYRLTSADLIKAINSM